MTISLEDPATGDPASRPPRRRSRRSAIPVTSILSGSNSRIRVTEQALAPDGTLEFSNGASFPIGDEDCDAVAFDSHSTSSAPAGPKPGAAPANDTPDGATDGCARQPTEYADRWRCNRARGPDHDLPGRAVRRDGDGRSGSRLKGPETRSPSTRRGATSTRSSAVYTLDGEAFVEVACIDDVELDPVGGSFQAVLTLDTEEGVTYYAQVGGFQNFFGGRPPVRAVATQGELTRAISAGVAPSRPSGCRPTSGARWCRLVRAPRRRSGRRSMTKPPGSR